MCDHAKVETDLLQDAVRALQEARRAEVRAKEEAQRLLEAAREDRENARTGLHVAIVEDVRTGRRAQKDIVKLTGYTRERIRQICRAAGIEAPDQ